MWLGTSVEDQAAADARIPELLATPAVVRFLSLEPLLGPVDLTPLAIPRVWGVCSPRETVRDIVRRFGEPMVDWVIVGGESGHRARPCDVAWIRSIVAQCKAAGVAVFCKQLGAHVVSEPLAWGVGESAHVVEGGRWRHKLRERHGGNPDEWPADLRVREFPGGVEYVTSRNGLRRAE